jgi:hypothetical protein
MGRRFEVMSGAFGTAKFLVLLACVGLPLTHCLVASSAASAPSFAAPSFARARSYATGRAPISVAIGDLNGDEKPDLATANFDVGVHTVSVLLNKGAGVFRRQLDYGTVPYPVSDLNGDRRQDLVVADSLAVSVIRNKPGLCDVQDLRRETLEAAKRTLARVNCRVGKVSLAYSRTIKGLVIGQKPKLGAVLPRGSRVDLVISRGGR